MIPGFSQRFTNAVWSAREKFLSRRRSPARAPIKGRMRNVIVIDPPDPIFAQAVFILRDDYFSQSPLSRVELLSQAREAAGKYTSSVLPPVRRSPLPWLLSALLFPPALYGVLIFLGFL